MVNGNPQNRPPVMPNKANCHNGSEPDEPNKAPNIGITIVNKATNITINIFDFVAIENNNAITKIEPRVNPNSQRLKFWSAVNNS